MSSVALAGVGVAYLGVIGSWLIVEKTPREPIADPYLAVMEVLTILSAVALVGYVVALWQIAVGRRRVPALVALVSGSLAAGLTTTVHFVQLTAVRQMWRAGELLDYRLVWPSHLFAVEYLAWDVLVGATMIATALALPDRSRAAPQRRALLAGGALCVAGVAGPLTGAMALQNIALIGYGVVLPVAAALSVRMFAAAPPLAAETPAR